MTPLLAGLGTQELVLIFLVVILLFGASKLPELARGSGRALRIFKAETKGLIDDADETKAKHDDVIDAIEVTPSIDVQKSDLDRRQAELDLERRQAELDAERARLNKPNS
ncbi:twin-arginine translocase TatA/TatE family subunit [Nocardioides sp.]|uniref:twin-arginine translocase TatA/TatE family subunit n=1 Tax=Nocardioides sp. TaxID=35761 RepID=UPI00261FBBC5|nr:twin-arginine translocase TatA/TatE family subunit [Nocardioides sp.]